MDVLLRFCSQLFIDTAAHVEIVSVIGGNLVAVRKLEGAVPFFIDSDGTSHVAQGEHLSANKKKLKGIALQIVICRFVLFSLLCRN